MLARLKSLLPFLHKKPCPVCEKRLAVPIGEQPLPYEADDWEMGIVIRCYEGNMSFAIARSDEAGDIVAFAYINGHKAPHGWKHDFYPERDDEVWMRDFENAPKGRRARDVRLRYRPGVN